MVYSTHHLTVTNNTGWTEFFVYAWGSSEAFGAWPGSDQTALDFQAADGEVTLHLIFHQDDGEDNRQVFDITEARDYDLVVTTEGVTENTGNGVEQVRSEQGHSTKVIRNGQLVIIRDGKMFNALGTEL